MENGSNTVVTTVTAEKSKNKGRQEWGRKLGKMSKELKLKKQEAKEKQEVVDVTAIQEQTRGEARWKYVLGYTNAYVLVCGVVVGALYYIRQKQYYSGAAAAAIPIDNENVNTVKTKFADF